MAISFIVTSMLFKDPDAADDEEEEGAETSDAPKPLENKISIAAPMTSQLIDLVSVLDDVFASGALGSSSST